MLYNDWDKDMYRRHLQNKIAVVAIMAVGLLGMAASAYAAVPSVVSVKLTGPTTITVVYSEPVTTNTWDYTNFSGALSGLGVESISGSGSDVITLTLSGTANLSNNSGYITIGTGLTSISTGSSFPGGSYNVTSAEAPILSSVSVSVQNIGDTFSALGSQILLTFSTNESVVNPTVTLLGHTIGVNGTGEGPYTVNYTVASGDAQGTIPATIMFTDTNGNSGSATVNILSNGTATTNGIGVTITSNAHTSGVLYPGSTITFTLTPSTVEPNARQVMGSYNGVPLSWYTTNNGVTYTGVYTVATGQGNTTYPVQINGVTLVDQYGNTLGPFSGSDVQETITATAPTSPISIYQADPVPSSALSTTPSYGFVSTEAGTASYAGDCSSPTAAVMAGLNTVTFNALADGTHSNCTITVTNSAGNVSNELVVSPFTVGMVATTTTAASVPTPITTATVPATSTAAQLQAMEAQLAQLETEQSSGSTAASQYDFTTFLSVGSEGAAVTALQTQLTKDGLYSGPITGYYGALTQTAVEKFQSSHGIAVKGYVGPGTRAALNSGE